MEFNGASSGLWTLDCASGYQPFHSLKDDASTGCVLIVASMGIMCAMIASRSLSGSSSPEDSKLQ